MRPPFVNLWDIAGVLVVALPFVMLGWLIGLLQFAHVVLVVALLVAAVYFIRRG